MVRYSLNRARVLSDNIGASTSELCLCFVLRFDSLLINTNFMIRKTDKETLQVTIKLGHGCITSFSKFRTD